VIFEARGHRAARYEACQASQQNREEKMCLRKLLLGTVAALVLAISPAMAQQQDPDWMRHGQPGLNGPVVVTPDGQQRELPRAHAQAQSPDIQFTPPNDDKRINDTMTFIGGGNIIVDHKIVTGAKMNGNTLELTAFVASKDAHGFVDRVCKVFRDNMEQDEPAMRVSVYHSNTGGWMAECRIVRK
jgi:hypothetical protein